MRAVNAEWKWPICPQTVWFVSKITERILTKCDLECLLHELLAIFDFQSYLSNIVSFLHQDQIEIRFSRNFVQNHGTKNSAYRKLEIFLIFNTYIENIFLCGVYLARYKKLLHPCIRN